MKAGGVFAHRISSAENFAGTEITRFGQSLFATMYGVFADIAVTSGDKSIFLAAQKQGILSLDFYSLRKNIESYFPEKDAPFQIETIRPSILPERLKFVRELYSKSELDGADLINSDNMPVTFFFNLLAGLKQTDSPLVSLLHALHRHGFLLTFALAAIFLILALHRRASRPSGGGNGFVESYAILMTGAAAIAIQIILMAGFQARYGFLYREIGIVNALFMAGLALGGFSFRKFFAPYLGATAVVISMLSYAVFVIALLFLPALPQQGTALLFYALFPLNGFIAGSIWPLVERASRGEALETASRLEMYDHIGAAAGALVCGFLMTPLFGTEGTLLILLSFFACGIMLASYETVARKSAFAFLDSFQKKEAPSFKNLSLSYVVFGGIIFFIASGIALKSRETATPELGAVEIKEVSLSEKKPFTRKEAPFLHYSFDDEKSGKILEVALSSLAVAPDVKGFAGAINLLMKIDGDGIIKTVKLLSSKETPVYIKGIGKWLKSFEGKSVAEDFRFEEGGEIDAMTGATITSEAALRIIVRTKNAVAGEILRIPFKESREKSLLETFTDVRTIYVILALAGSIAVYYLAGSLVRLLWLLMNLILGGVVFNIQFSITHLYNLLSLEIPSPEGGYIFFLFAGIIILIPLFGPVYCGQMCPFGALQELISRIFTFKGMKPSQALENAMRGIKYLLLLFFTAVFLFDEPHGFFLYDPLANFFNFKYFGMMI
ncbi:MAG: FMN-binding protein, partial [Deltaproteobacteria bacterium]|nr:FMN-binding protein [Deltaproteobacteria bacterium]